MSAIKATDRCFEALDYGKEQKAKLTVKQYLVYAYLMSISWWNADDGEEHYYVYKNAFQVKDAAAALGISQPTWRSALDKLEELEYIKRFDKFYHIYIPNTYAPLDIELIRFLVQFGKEIKGGGAIVSVYSLIYKYWHFSGNHCEITTTQLRKLFNTQGKKEDTAPYRIMLNIFENEGLILTEHHERIYKGKPYTGYEIKYVSLKLPKGIKLDDYGPEDISDIVNTLEREEKSKK